MAQKLMFDRVLFATVAVLTLFGLVMVYSASAVVAREGGRPFNPLFVKQCAAAAVGWVLMLVVLHLDYRGLRRPAVVYALLFAVLALLVGVLFGPTINNSRRWFLIAGISVQPSELAKLALVPYVAYQIDKKLPPRSPLTTRGDAPAHPSWGFLLPVCFVTAVMAVLILAGRDLGTATLLCLPPFVLFILAEISLRNLLVGGAMLLPLVGVGIMLAPYRIQRFLVFLDPEKEPLGSGFQLLQSLIAVGSGGLFGLGPGNSVQKLFFLPSPHADFIFSIVAEELGFVGALCVVALFGVVLWRGARTGLRAPDALGRFLAWGFTAFLVVQALVHISVALALVPTTGLPLPFISHGGSSLVTSLVACGVVLNVSQHGVEPVSEWMK